MPTKQEPLAGNWYRKHDDSRKFRVIAVEEDNDLIRIQYADDSLEELDFATWQQLELHTADPPLK